MKQMGIVLSPFISKKPNSDSLCLGGRIFLLQNLKHGESTQDKPFFVPQSPSSAFVLWKMALQRKAERVSEGVETKQARMMQG